jgi:hypothetical protein
LVSAHEEAQRRLVARGELLRQGAQVETRRLAQAAPARVREPQAFQDLRSLL